MRLISVLRLEQKLLLLQDCCIVVLSESDVLLSGVHLRLFMLSQHLMVPCSLHNSLCMIIRVSIDSSALLRALNEMLVQVRSLLLLD